MVVSRNSNGDAQWVIVMHGMASNAEDFSANAGDYGVHNCYIVTCAIALVEEDIDPSGRLMRAGFGLVNYGFIVKEHLGLC